MRARVRAASSCVCFADNTLPNSDYSIRHGELRERLVKAVHNSRTEGCDRSGRMASRTEWRCAVMKRHSSFSCRLFVLVLLGASLSRAERDEVTMPVTGALSSP